MKKVKRTRKTKVRLGTPGQATLADLMTLSVRALMKREEKLFSALRKGFDMGTSLEIGRVRRAITVKNQS